MADKKHEAKKGKPSSAGRRKDSISRYWAARAPRNKERQLRKAIRRAIKLSGEGEAARNVATSSLASGEKIEDGLKRFNSVLANVSKEQLARWTAARENRLAFSLSRKEAKRAERAARLAEIEAAKKDMAEAIAMATEKYLEKTQDTSLQPKAGAATKFKAKTKSNGS